jgi:hypothetical protein
MKIEPGSGTGAAGVSGSGLLHGAAVLADLEEGMPRALAGRAGREQLQATRWACVGIVGRSDERP